MHFSRSKRLYSYEVLVVRAIFTVSQGKFFLFWRWGWGPFRLIGTSGLTSKVLLAHSRAMDELLDSHCAPGNHNYLQILVEPRAGADGKPMVPSWERLCF